GKKTSTFWEGCLSIGVGKDSLYGPVTRSRKLEVEYLDRKGKKKKKKFTDFMSHVIQHEVDHLNGVLFLSHIKKPENVWKSLDLDKYLKEHKEFPKTR
ncbi:MAG TPA: hypothetical protein ENI23_15315, partial [bacterium]|nr:hypothetical protein [bacterium]